MLQERHGCPSTHKTLSNHCISVLRAWIHLYINTHQKAHETAPKDGENLRFLEAFKQHWLSLSPAASLRTIHQQRLGQPRMAERAMLKEQCPVQTSPHAASSAVLDHKMKIHPLWVTQTLTCVPELFPESSGMIPNTPEPLQVSCHSPVTRC